MSLADYQFIAQFVQDVGHRLRQKSGQIPDLRTGKLWVTEEDVAIERELSALVRSINPDAVIFAEEEHDMFQQSDDIWIIDPISHTFNFIHGLPHYAIVISRMVKNEVVFALAYDVSNGELFTAHKNEGSYLNDQKLTVNNDLSSPAIMYDPHPVGDHKLSDNIKIHAALSTIGRVKTFGSMALNYAYVAAGRAQAAVSTPQDAFPEFAGLLIIKEAGGLLTDFEGQELTVKTRRVIAACNVTFHQQIKEAIHSALRQ